MAVPQKYKTKTTGFPDHALLNNAPHSASRIKSCKNDDKKTINKDFMMMQNLDSIIHPAKCCFATRHADLTG